MKAHEGNIRLLKGMAGTTSSQALAARQPLIKQWLLRQPMLKQWLLRQPMLKQWLLRQPMLKQRLLRQPMLEQPLPKWLLPLCIPVCSFFYGRTIFSASRNIFFAGSSCSMSNRE